MAHLIILDRTERLREDLQSNESQMQAVHDAFHAMLAGAEKTAAQGLIDAHASTLKNTRSEIDEQFSAIRTAVGL